MTQRFIEFIMMQAQQAALFLGRLPNPQTGKAEPNLDVARMLIDQLEMIREKTRGNLNHEETEILASILSDLQLGYVQATSAARAPPRRRSPRRISPAMARRRRRTARSVSRKATEADSASVREG